MIQNLGKLRGKTVLITGASRGFGQAFAQKVASDGANVVVLAKTTVNNPKIPGTIYQTADEVTAAGGQCLPLSVDVRDESAVRSAIDATIEKFGQIDVVVNNASSMYPHGIMDLEMKQFNLMNDVILRGTFMITKFSLPHLLKSDNPHILNICPPLQIINSWFKHLGHLAVMKYAISMSTLSLSEDLKESGVGVNGLWPKTAFWSAFVSRAGGYTEALRKYSRKPSIMTDAAYLMVTKDAKEFTGNFLYDDDVLVDAGVTDFESYAEEPGNPLMVDIFVRDEDCKTFKPLASTEDSISMIRQNLSKSKI